MPWQATSPDMSPIEHVQDILNKVEKTCPCASTCITELPSPRIGTISRASIQNVVNSIRRRCVACIIADGGQIRVFDHLSNTTSDPLDNCVSYRPGTCNEIAIACNMMRIQLTIVYSDISYLKIKIS
jgi:hypothetical protein